MKSGGKATVPAREGRGRSYDIVDGGGHTWPRTRPRTWVLGKSTKDVSANELDVGFFEEAPHEVSG